MNAEESLEHAFSTNARIRNNNFRGRGQNQYENTSSWRGRNQSFHSFRGSNRGRSPSPGRGRGWNPRGRGRGRSNYQCGYCKRFGHSEEECYFKKADLQRKEVNTVVAETDRSENLFCVSTEERDEEKEWYIDSGCSTHMSCNESWFENLKIDESKSSKVVLGDNNTQEVNGSGVVSIQAKDGQKKLIHNVLHVPALKKNLLSVA